MYIVRNRYHEYKGESSITIKKELGVYQKSYDSPPVSGATLRIEANLRDHQDFEVREILEETETRVVFKDQNLLVSEWLKVV